MCNKRNSVKFLTIIIFFIVIIFLVKFCSNIINNNLLYGNEMKNGEYMITNIRIFKDTPVWELAKAVKSQKTSTIKRIVKSDPELINFQEPKYGATLLFWSIGMEKYKSAEALLQCGADPNIASNTLYKSALFLAAGYSWIDNNAKNDPKYVKILVLYGADPNINHNNKSETFLIGTSPLMRSIGAGIEKTKTLVESGADINYKTKSGTTAAILALWMGGPNATIKGMKYAHYLIAEKKANVSEPYFREDNYGNEDPDEKFFPVNILRDWICDIDSEEYKIKMEIVEEFARQGINYWETEISEERLEHIKRLYPTTWEEYIKKY